MVKGTMFGWMRDKNKHENQASEGTSQKVTLALEGMHCTSCALVIDDALEELPGVQGVKTEYARSQVVVEIDPTVLSVEKMISEIAQLGYSATIKHIK